MKEHGYTKLAVIGAVTLIVLFVVGYILAVFPNLIQLTLRPQRLVTILVLTLSILLTLQGLFTLVWMLYAWEDPENVENHKSPKQFKAPQFSFTTLLPARYEEKVIEDTIVAVDKIIPRKVKGSACSF